MGSPSKTVRLKNIRQENPQLRRGATVIGDILYAPGGACGPRIQHDYQLVVVHTGCVDLQLDKKTIHVSQGQAILLTPGHREHFIFSADQETHHSWCAIDPTEVPPKLRREFQTLRGPSPFVGRMHTLLEMSKRPQFGSAKNPLEDGFYLGLCLALMCDFASKVKSGKKSPAAGEVVLAKMEEFIWKRFADRLTLYDISRGVAVSRQHLLKVCRMQGRPTPMAQLYQARLEVATDLLRQTGLPISEVAGKCGFISSFHFSRKFKQVYGKSPTAWRRELWRANREHT